MFKSLFLTLPRSAVRISIVLGVVAAFGLTITHSLAMTKVSTSHEVAPIDPTCSSSLPGIEYDNNSAGPGIRGISVSGNGLAGATKNTSASGRAGLLGNDISSSGTFNSGVSGPSVRGTGVLGNSTSGDGTSGISQGTINGQIAGVYGQNNSNFGLNTSNTNAGVFGQALTGVGVLRRTGENIQDLNFSCTNCNVSWLGVEGKSPGGVGALGITTSLAPQVQEAPLAVGDGVQGSGNIGADLTGQEVLGIGPQIPGVGISVLGTGGAGAHIVANDLSASSSVGSYGLPALYVEEDDPSGIVMIAHGSGSGTSKDVMSLDSSGNMILSGTLQQNGTPLAAQRTVTGRSVETYSAQQTQPTIEDFGQGELVQGSGFVRLANDFAVAIDQTKSYMVFLTPDGDNAGLYVAQKTAQGFIVREDRGGHDSLAFDYRIVAKPFAKFDTRLPVARNLGSTKGRFGPRFTTHSTLQPPPPRPLVKSAPQ